MGLVSVALLWPLYFTAGTIYVVFFVLLWVYLITFALGCNFGLGPLSYIQRNIESEYKNSIKAKKQPWEQNDSKDT